MWPIKAAWWISFSLEYTYSALGKSFSRYSLRYSSSEAAAVRIMSNSGGNVASMFTLSASGLGSSVSSGSRYDIDLSSTVSALLTTITRPSWMVGHSEATSAQDRHIRVVTAKVYCIKALMACVMGGESGRGSESGTLNI